MLQHLQTRTAFFIEIRCQVIQEVGAHLPQMLARVAAPLLDRISNNATGTNAAPTAKPSLKASAPTARTPCTTWCPERIPSRRQLERLQNTLDENLMMLESFTPEWLR